MLRLIPRAPRKISRAGIETALRDEGFEINRRTIQRDLQHLAGVFPLIVDDQHVPYGWSWARALVKPALHFRRTVIPGLTGDLNSDLRHTPTDRVEILGSGPEDDVFYFQ
jgi:hypothetical protein